MTPRPQLKTGIWIDALIRRAHVAGAFACVLQSGDRDAGSVIVAVRGRDSLTLYIAERDMEGQRVWRPAVTDEEAMAATLKARLNFDSDLNVIEVDDRKGRHFIEEPVMSDHEAALSEETAASAAALAAAKAVFRGQ